MSLSKNFNEFFILSDKKSEEWDSKLFEYGYANDVEGLENHLNGTDEIYLEERQIYTAIYAFTLDTKTKKEKMRLINSLKKEKFIKKINTTKSTLLIETLNGKIKTCKLTEMIPGLKEDDPNIATEERQGKCHKQSIIISNSLGDISNDVVTGFIFGYSNKAKYLHSWVEFNYNDEDVVIDYTLNALMNKDGYYQIQHAIPLSRISNKSIKEDNKILKKFGQIGAFNMKEYLLYRDEIMKDFDKNRALFDEER